MDLADRKKLEELALERLHATINDEEQWSFLFRTPDAVDLLYCPWSVTEDWEFDGVLENLDLPWGRERLQLIKRGEADPNNEELRQWRQAKCRELAAGSDWCWIAWIVPLTIDGKIAGHALFVCPSDGDPDDAPILEGVFDSAEEAEAALTEIGAVAGAG